MTAENIILVGFMGSGKTSVGRWLAALLKREFIDTDEEVERVTGLAIPEIFARYGESRFRKEEALAVARICQGKDQVIATGGGVVLNPLNISAMRRAGYVIWLEADPETIQVRVWGKRDRPLLSADQSLERIQKMLAQREPYYRSCSHLSINTSHRTVGEVAEQVVARLREIRGRRSGDEWARKTHFSPEEEE